MKHTFFTLFILLSCMAAQAAPISETEARSNVFQFLNTKGKQKIKGARSLTLVHTIYHNGENQSDGSPMLYIFNVNGGQGYVVAAADDVAPFRRMRRVPLAAAPLPDAAGSQAAAGL